ncbi:MAG: DUF2304 domain-containing protein [Actinomycetota bacterium]|nr:DUF2304 domain-containing protein [Candidatus Dormibacteraeota bacterium]MDQ6945554.1 DUF2304 domain-containing protein [Actinomycetota bacterium]
MTLRIRLIVAIIALLCLLLVALQVRRREMRAKYLVLWTSLCLLAMLLVLFPAVVDSVSLWLGIYYPPAAVLLVAVIVLFLIIVHLSRDVSRLEERSRTLAEELALQQLMLDKTQRPPTVSNTQMPGRPDREERQ